MSEQLKRLQVQREKLQDLAAQLHEVNQALIRATGPLERASDMNDQQRGQLADEIRAGQARWDAVTREISQALEAGSANSS